MGLCTPLKLTTKPSLKNGKKDSLGLLTDEVGTPAFKSPEIIMQ
jgi:hypothetical protein